MAPFFRIITLAILLHIAPLFASPAMARVIPCDEIFDRLAAPRISAKEAGILDRAILRDFEDLFQIEAPTPADAVRWNNKVLSALRRIPRSSPEPGELSGLNPLEIQSLYDEMKNNKVIKKSCDTDYYEKDPDLTVGFCFGRAIGVHLLARNRHLSNDAIRKVWVVGKMMAGIEWSHHVATAVRRLDGEWVVLDTYFDEPVSVAKWLSHWRSMGPDGKMLLLATKADRFGPEGADPIFEETLKKSEYGGFFHDLFKSARKETEKAIDQLRKLSPDVY